ncbi:alpha/beta hydrolase fold domain-containing protein [Halobacteriovorax sp. XZX-3]|uniref:alpha/beta hydrolase fold domain-containing protein n=1 Tax=unclassified Halobacteriovorax TaxID=2639665 RepID=UPI00371EDA9D
MSKSIAEFIHQKRLSSMQSFFDVGIKRFSRITLDELRRAMDLIEGEYKNLVNCSIQKLNDHTCLVWGEPKAHCIIHLHSGGYVTGHEYTSAQFCQALFDFHEHSSYIVCPDYPLSPESSIPEITNWCLALLNDLHLKGIKSFTLTGTSAGANLATLVTLANNHLGSKAFKISDLHLLTGHYQSDFETTSANRYESGEESGLSKSMLLKLLDYAISNREVHMKDPAIFPLYSDELEALPKTIIYAAKYDVLYDDSLMFYEKLLREGVDVTFKEFSHGFHAWSNHILENEELLNYAKAKIFTEIKGS